jgi:hypothetical protein
MDCNEKVNFKTIYLVIRPGLVIVHHVDPRPIDSSQAPYVLIIIEPDRTGTTIKNISTTYVYGTESGEYVQYQTDNIDLNSLLTGSGSTVLEKLQCHFLSLSGETLRNIIHPTEPELNGVYCRPISTNINTDILTDTIVYPRPPTISLHPITTSSPCLTTSGVAELTFPGSTDFECFMSLFLVGISTHFSASDIIRYKQSTIQHPFDPIEIMPPSITDQAEDILTQGVGEYLGYYARTLQAIVRGRRCVTSVGPTWLSLIDHFWKGYATCFHQGTLTHSTTAIHDTMVGYCRHQDQRITEIESRFTEISTRAEQYLSNIQSTGKNIMDQIEMTSQKTIQDITRVSQETADNLTRVISDLETRVSDLSTNSLATIQEEKESIVSSLVTLRSDAQKSINQWTDEGVLRVQTVYSQGYDEIVGLKTGAAETLQNEHQRGLDQFANRQDQLFLEIDNSKNKIIRDLAQLHNEGIEKNFQMVENRKKDLLEFNEHLIRNLDQTGQSHLQSTRIIRDETQTISQTAIQEIELKVSGTEDKFRDLITISLTNMLDQQNHIINGVQAETAKAINQRLDEILDRAVENALHRLGDGIDKIVVDAMDQHTTDQIMKMETEVSRVTETANRVQLESIDTRKVTLELRDLLAEARSAQQQLNLRIRYLERFEPASSQVNHNYLEPDQVTPISNINADSPSRSYSPSPQHDWSDQEDNITPYFSPHPVTLISDRPSSPIVKIISGNGWGHNDPSQFIRLKTLQEADKIC